MKPDNIFLTEDGIAKIGDYGLSSQLNHTQSVREYAGTQLYVSPEAYHGKMGMPNDCWSLGMILIELAEGRHPYRDMNSTKLMITVREEDPPSLSREKWSADFVDFVSKCLVKKANERWTTSQLMEVCSCLLLEP